MGLGEEIFVEKHTFTYTEWKDMEANGLLAPIVPLGCWGALLWQPPLAEFPSGWGQPLSTMLESSWVQ